MQFALLKPFFHYKFLLYQLTQREIKARYKQSLVGYAWILFNPLAQLLVYSFVFSIVFRFPTNGVPYPLFLYAGLLPWILLQSSLMAATVSLVDNTPLLRKIAFPREIIPYSVISAKVVDFVFSCIVLLLFFVFFRQPLHWSILAFFPIVLCQLILMTGMSLVLSASNLFYRDIQYLMNLFLMLWMYMSPVVYPTNLVPEKYQQLYALNPLVGLLEGYRYAFFGTPFHAQHLMWSFAVSCVVFIVGYLFFKKSEKVFADIA